MTNPNAWGANEKSYAHRSDDRHFFDLDRSLPERWKRILGSEVQRSVERAKQRWLRTLRDQVRNETRLRLSGHSGAHTVPVEVTGALPHTVSRVLQEHNDLEWQLLLHRLRLEEVVDGVHFMEEHFPDVRQRFGERTGPADLGDLRRVRETADAWSDLVRERSIMEQIFGINEDVLGAYFFRVPKIQIYWIVIGIVARLLKVSVEALTVVVLAHELAHAYTHRGFDIDGQRWDTNAFARSDLDVVEGLAQYFTEAVFRKMVSSWFAPLSAFETLLSVQSRAYRAYRKWIRHDDPQGGEIVRVSMIACRRQGPTTSERFTDAISNYRRTVGGSPNTPSQLRLSFSESSQ